MEGLTEGRIVHYVMPNGEHRPAIVVNVWKVSGSCEGYVNLVVFVDGSNDVKSTREVLDIATTLWETSVCFDDKEKPSHTWHWIEKA